MSFSHPRLRQPLLLQGVHLCLSRLGGQKCIWMIQNHPVGQSGLQSPRSVGEGDQFTYYLTYLGTHGKASFSLQGFLLSNSFTREVLKGHLSCKSKGRNRSARKLARPFFRRYVWPWYACLQKSYLLSSTGAHLFPGLQTPFSHRSPSKMTFLTQ